MFLINPLFWYRYNTALFGVSVSMMKMNHRTMEAFREVNK